MRIPQRFLITPGSSIISPRAVQLASSSHAGWSYSKTLTQIGLDDEAESLLVAKTSRVVRTE